MNGVLRQIFIALLVCGVIGAGPPCRSEQPGDSIKEKVMGKWGQYVKKTKAIRVHCAINVSFDTEDGRVNTHGEYFATSQGGQNRCVQFRLSDGNASNSMRLKGRNSEYIFDLVQNEGDSKKWLLRDSPSRLDNKDLKYYVKNFLSRIQAEFDMVTVSIGDFIFGIHDLEFYVEHQDDLKLTLVEEQKNGELKAKFFFSEELDAPYFAADNRELVFREIEGEVVLASDSFYLPVEYQLQMKLKDSRGNVGISGKINQAFEYSEASPIKLIRTEKKSVFKDEDGNETSRHEIIEIKKWELAPDLTEADFRLPAFGLPEPPFVKPKRSWVLYLAVIAICLALIGGTVWLKRRIKP